MFQETTRDVQAGFSTSVAMDGKIRVFWEKFMRVEFALIESFTHNGIELLLEFGKAHGLLTCLGL